MLRKTFYIMILLLIGGFTYSQSITEKDLEGCWKLVSIVSDGSALIDDDNSEIVVTCFEGGGKFLTKEIGEGKESIIGTGNYRILPDGKTIVQDRGVDDGGIDADMMVSSFSNDQLTFVSGNVTMKYKRFH